MRNTYIPMHHPLLATVITQSQMQVQLKLSLAHLQELIPTLGGEPCIYVFYTS